MKDHRRYKVNDNFFKIWSHDSAYLAGLIASDGCLIAPNKKSPDIVKLIQFRQSEKDIDLLKNILILLDSSYPVKLTYSKIGDKKFPVASLNINSKILCDDLINIGIVPNKSLILKWPANIPKDYCSSFIRGYMDGDGCIDTFKDKRLKNYLRLRIRFAGTKDFISGMEECIFNILNISGSISENKIAKNHYELSYRSSSAEVLGKWIYQNSNDKARLERKYKLFLEILEITKSSDKNMSLSEAIDLKRAINLDIPTNILSEYFKKSITTIKNLKYSKTYNMINDKKSCLYLYKAKVIRVIDADTIILSVDIGFKIFAEQKYRLAGIDTPEMSTTEGKNAKNFLDKILPVGKEVLLDSQGLDKYGRWLGNIYYIENESKLIFINQELIKAGFAKEYFGGKKV